MALSHDARPFCAMAYDLDPATAKAKRVSLAPMPANEAPRLGAVFAAIDPWMSYPYPASELAAYFCKAEPSAPRFALYADGDIAGIVGMRLDWLRGPFLQFLGLVPDAQGKGLGGCVLAWMELEARRGDERNLWVTASDFNTRATGFYKRHGFSEVARLAGLVRDDRTETLLRKKLI